METWESKTSAHWNILAMTFEIRFWVWIPPGSWSYQLRQCDLRVISRAAVWLATTDCCCSVPCQHRRLQCLINDLVCYDKGVIDRSECTKAQVVTLEAFLTLGSSSRETSRGRGGGGRGGLSIITKEGVDNRSVAIHVIWDQIFVTALILHERMKNIH